MAGDYRLGRIGDVASSISDTHPMTKTALVFLNTSDILHGKFLHRDYTAVKDWPGQAKKSIRRDDILFSEIRPANGRWAFVEEDADDFVVSTKLMVIRPHSDKVLPRYLYLFLTSRDNTAWLQHLAESRSGTFPQITFDQVASLDIPLPPLPEQKRIAHILGTLDDKIELNRRMNATLEGISRAIFKSWFVDFDPVRQKAAGQQPVGMDVQTAALFPDSFEESEIGEVPMGWGTCPLSECVEILSGGTPSTSNPEYWGGSIPWFSVKDAPSDCDVWVIWTEKSITQAGIDNSAAQILPPGTTIVSARGTVGRLALVGVPMAMNQSCYGIRGVGGLNDLFVYYLLRGSVAELRQRTHGTVFDTITRDTVASLFVAAIPRALAEAFGDVASPLLEAIRCNLAQSRTLAALRDTLLPKLLSGEIRVPEAEEAVAEVIG